MPAAAAAASPATLAATAPDSNNGSDKYAAFGLFASPEAPPSASGGDKYAGLVGLDGDVATTGVGEPAARLLEACIGELQNGVRIGTNVQAAGVAHEVKSSEKWSLFLDGLRQIYLVGTRVVFASQTSQFGGLAAQKLVGTFHEVAGTLNATFSAFECTFEPPQYTAGAAGEKCGVCGVSTADVAVSTPAISCMGRMFYADAANLWRKKVDSMLPAH